MMKLKRIQQLILLGIVLVIVGTAVLLLSEIGENDEQAEQEAIFTSTTTSALKQYKPNSLNGYISNPGIGWQYMDSSDKSIMPETVAYPDRSEISWKILNPGNGVTNFSKLDSKITNAKSSGKQISFRVYTQSGEGFGGHQMPAWVVNLGVPLVTGDGESQPDYSNCIYQNQWGRFVNALRQRYDGNTDIAYIDISGYGNFNEWGWADGIPKYPIGNALGGDKAISEVCL